MDLLSVFQEINAAHFDGFLEPPQLKWNPRLRSSAGRFVPGSRRSLLGHTRKPRIEIAPFILTAQDGSKLPDPAGIARAPETESSVVRDTLGHEMIHYWLWCLGRPYGHTPEFYRKMKEMGVSRFHTLLTPDAPRHVYRCPECAREFRTKRKIVKRDLACRECCNQHAAGRYSARFKLVYEGSFARPEVRETCG